MIICHCGQRTFEALCSKESQVSLNNKYEGYQSIEFLNIGNRFLSDDDSISDEIMSDGVHLTEKGYKIWSEALEPVFRKMFGAISMDDIEQKFPAGDRPKVSYETAQRVRSEED